MRHGGPEDLVRACQRQGIVDARLLEAVRSVPRAGFVPADRRADAYRDTPLPIAHGQVTTQPTLVAAMIEALELSGRERVLEVGTGLGWQTALLARLARRVWSIERFADLAAAARDNLAGVGITNATVVVGDGSAGLPAHSPYDAIVVAAAFTAVPEPLADQLARDTGRSGAPARAGRLVQPVGPGGAEDVVLFTREPVGLVRQRRITGAHFVRLEGRYGFPSVGSEEEPG